MTEVLNTVNPVGPSSMPLDSFQSQSERLLAEVLEEEKEQVQSPTARSCAFCGTTNSPSWRKGPSGKGSLCNACATNWINRQRAIAQAKAKNEYKRVMSNVNASPGSRGKEKEREKEREFHQREGSDDDEKGMRDDNKERENYYCKYCDKTWPLSYFRNRQQFGAHCSNCSRKRKPRAFGEEPVTEVRQRRPKKARRRSASPNDSGSPNYEDEEDLQDQKVDIISTEFEDTLTSSPSSSPSFEKGLMERLLNVVENKLVEVNELEMIRKELQLMRSELLRREDKRQSRFDEVKNKIVNGMTELKSKMTEELTQKEEECKKEFEDMRDEVMVEFVLKERDIKSIIENASKNASAPQDDSSERKERNEVIQKHMQDLRASLDRRLDEIKKKMGMEVNEMEKLVEDGITKCEESIQKQLSDLSAELNYQLEEVRIRFLTLEKVIKDDPRVVNNMPSPYNDQQ
jgi:hypothetical protein